MGNNQFYEILFTILFLTVLTKSHKL